MKPLIGINLDLAPGPPAQASIQTTYYEAVLSAGGIPVLLPPMSDQDLTNLTARLNGLMLIGGRDYSPSLYGEDKHESCELISPEREEFDLRLLNLVLKQTAMPVLGICGGCQLLNITLGGSLIQDIPTALPDSKVIHTKRKGGRSTHKIILQEASSLARIYGSETLEVPTSHHQAVNKPGAGLVPTAWAEDGVIEAVELPDRPFTIGVQWHPERDFAGNERLFRAFVDEASNSRNGN